MKRFFFSVLMSFLASGVFAQPVARVDKKTKEFNVPPNAKTDYQIFGYEYANNTTKKMICFSSHVGDVKDNYNHCPLGSYFDTNKMKMTDKILYLGPTGSFAKMSYVAGDGKKTIFYIPKSSFTIQ